MVSTTCGINLNRDKVIKIRGTGDHKARNRKQSASDDKQRENSEIFIVRWNGVR